MQADMIESIAREIGVPPDQVEEYAINRLQAEAIAGQVTVPPGVADELLEYSEALGLSTDQILIYAMWCVHQHTRGGLRLLCRHPDPRGRERLKRLLADSVGNSFKR